MDIDRELNTKNLSELKVLAQRLKVHGRSNKNKDELITLLLAQDPQLLRRELKRTWWYKYHHHVYGVATLVGLLVALITFVPFVTPQRAPSTPTNGSLAIADLKILEGSPRATTHFPVLDVMFRNPGDVAVLKEVTFYIHAVYEAMTYYETEAIDVSWVYDVELPILGSPTSVTIPIHQEVPSNGTDRFQIVLGNDAPPTLSSFLFDVSVEFVYDEDDKRLRSQRLLFLASPSQRVIGMATMPNRIPESLTHNMKLVRVIDDFDGHVSTVTRHWANNVNTWLPNRIEEFQTANTIRRHELCNLFGSIGYEARAALPILRQIASDPNSELRNLAQQVISRIESAQPDTILPLIPVDYHETHPSLLSMPLAENKSRPHQRIQPLPPPDIPGSLQPEMRDQIQIVNGTIGPIPEGAVGYTYVLATGASDAEYYLAPTPLWSTPHTDNLDDTALPGDIHGFDVLDTYVVTGTIGPIPANAVGREYIAKKLPNDNYRLVLRASL